MADEYRPNPEELLKVVRREESQRRKGKLKIFLGMAAGVGKTYAMLEEAQKLKSEGVDIIVGSVATHGRQETAKLLQGLEIVPEKWIKYKDAVFEELDIDAILKRKPQIVIVDELAHSNVPGSRHPKRWQDVMEILDNGIDVYTTLNVQHIESLKDVVEHIAGITIRETVPDIIVDQAAFIELVDLTPHELLRRLKEGKVYLGDQSAIAASHFFQEDRLTALREIVLRLAAEKVDHDLKGMVSTVQREDAWKPRERLLVAVSHSPHSQKLIRITRRLAFNLDAPWIAVHVDTGEELDENDRATLAKNLTLARDLGAEVITTSEADIAEGIQRIARQKSVTQIILGRTPTRFWNIFSQSSLMERLAKECSDIDLHVIRQTLFPKSYGKKLRLAGSRGNFFSYFTVLCFVLALTTFSWMLLDTIGYKIVGFIFLMSIMLMSLFFKKGPILFGSILYALIWGLFFIPLQEDYAPHLNEDIVLLIFYFITAVCTGVLIDRGKKNKEMLVKRERSIEALYDIVQEITSSPNQAELLNSIKERMCTVLDGKCDIAIKKMDDGLIFDDSHTLFKNEKEKAAAIWVFQNGKEAGWSTSTLPMSENLYVPLKGHKDIMGVIAFRPKDSRELNIEEKNFIYTVGQQLANYIERVFSEEKNRQYEQHKQIEKIYHSILNLIENLFEGPLLTIQDAVKELKNQSQELLEENITPLERISNACQSLSHILENISAMVNLSAGLMPIRRSKNDIKQLVQTCFERITKTEIAYNWKLKLDPDIPDLVFDYDLIELLFYNMVFHAMEFSLPESEIEIEVTQSGDYVMISVSGEGQSIPPEMIDIAFEKFYRLPGTSSTGLGLGLAIARVIAEIHGGILKVKNRPAGGMIFIFYLPVE